MLRIAPAALAALALTLGACATAPGRVAPTSAVEAASVPAVTVTRDGDAWTATMRWIATPRFGPSTVRR